MAVFFLSIKLFVDESEEKLHLAHISERFHGQISLVAQLLD